MHITGFSRLLLSVCGMLLTASSSAIAQGSLTPPAGPPSASMKTLDQVEPRKAVQSLSAAAPYTITQPGSYYLTGNITVAGGSAIIVDADDVTIDLNGFIIRSTQTGSSSGAGVEAARNIQRLAVTNGSILSGTTLISGTITGAGFNVGIGSEQKEIHQGIVTSVRISGMAKYGVYLDRQGTVDRCAVSRCGVIGIYARSVTGSSALECQAGIRAAIATQCEGHGTTGFGIDCRGINETAGIVTNCIGNSTSGYGIAAETAMHSIARSASGPQALLVNSTASFCRADRPGGVAIQAQIAVGCSALNGTIQAAQKHLGTP